MSKQLTSNLLSYTVGALCLTFLAGIQNASATDLGADPQVQAAHLLQHQFIWSTGTDRFQQFEHRGGKTHTSQEQAQRILQPFNDVTAIHAEYVRSIRFITSTQIEPQLQAAKMLNHNLGCRSLEC